MTALPALPDYVPVASAKLPANYEAAVQAVADCVSLDQCQDWADKLAAVASYARQAEDDRLTNYAVRLQSRAIRRCGELLKQFDGKGRNQHTEDKAVDHPKLSQREAAASAGMSEHQQKTAVRVANLRADTFERAIEAEKPATVTKLAEMGKQSRPVPAPQYAPPPKGFQQATHVIGTVREFAEFCAKTPPELVANGVMTSEVEEIRKLVGQIDNWLDRFVVNLGKAA